MTFWACLNYLSSTEEPTGSMAESSVCSATAVASSEGIATSPRCFRALPISTPCVCPSLPASFIPLNISDSFVISGTDAAAVLPTCMVQPEILSFWAPQHPSLKRFFGNSTHNLNQDLGGSGSNLRTPSDCVGQARCEWACYDTQALCHDLTVEYQDELHRPAFPYKFKFKFDGCPNCCVASIARADLSFVGTWRDDIGIDQEAVAAYMGGELPPNGGCSCRT